MCHLLRRGERGAFPKKQSFLIGVRCQRRRERCLTMFCHGTCLESFDYPFWSRQSTLMPFEQQASGSQALLVSVLTTNTMDQAAVRGSCGCWATQFVTPLERSWPWPTKRFFKISYGRRQGRSSWQASTLHFALQLWDTRPPGLGQPHREVWQRLNLPRVYLTHQSRPGHCGSGGRILCWAGPRQWAGLRVALRTANEQCHCPTPIKKSERP